MTDDPYTDDSIWAAFETAVVTITLEDGTPFVVGSAPLPWSEVTHILTAWNPGERRSDTDNRTANERLAARIDELGATRLDAVGASPDASWSEDGFAVVGLGRALAVSVANDFGQMAIYEAAGTGLTVISCDAEGPRTAPGGPTPR